MHGQDSLFFSSLHNYRVLFRGNPKDMCNCLAGFFHEVAKPHCFWLNDFHKGIMVSEETQPSFFFRISMIFSRDSEPFSSFFAASSAVFTYAIVLFQA